MLSLTINQLDPPVITSVTEASGIVNTPFIYQVHATNNPNTYQATGLPSGLSINSMTGLISGTPTSIGTSTVIVSATNVSGAGSVTLNLTINLPEVPAISSGLIAEGQVGFPFFYQILATNNPTQYVAVNLPSGLSLDTASGLITGTPSVDGSFEVLIKAENSGGGGAAPLSLTIFPMVPVISSGQSITGTVNQELTYQITTLPQANYYSAANLPSGLTIDSSTGLISGAVSEVGTYLVTISATNSGGTGIQQATITILPEAPVIEAEDGYVFEVSEIIDIALTATNPPTSYSALGLPEGLFIDTKSGVITGTLLNLGNYSFSVMATNAGGTGSKNLTIEIIDGPTRIASFSPTVVDPYETITIHGTGFTDTCLLYTSPSPRD